MLSPLAISDTDIAFTLVNSRFEIMMVWREAESDTASGARIYSGSLWWETFRSCSAAAEKQAQIFLSSGITAVRPVGEGCAGTGIPPWKISPSPAQHRAPKLPQHMGTGLAWGAHGGARLLRCFLGNGASSQPAIHTKPRCHTE